MLYILSMPYRQCKKPGCTTLVPAYGESSGYCPKHAYILQERMREAFDRLKERQSPQERAFYSSKAWTETSRLHRIREPLCRRCKAEEKIVAGALVHHNPPLRDLLETGRNPLEDKYLETLCIPHHQKELIAEHKKTT